MRDLVVPWSATPLSPAWFSPMKFLSLFYLVPSFLFLSNFCGFLVLVPSQLVGSNSIHFHVYKRWLIEVTTMCLLRNGIYVIFYPDLWMKMSRYLMWSWFEGIGIHYCCLTQFLRCRVSACRKYYFNIQEKILKNFVSWCWRDLCPDAFIYLFSRWWFLPLAFNCLTANIVLLLYFYISSRILMNSKPFLNHAWSWLSRMMSGSGSLYSCLKLTPIMIWPWSQQRKYIPNLKLNLVPKREKGILVPLYNFILVHLID